MTELHETSQTLGTLSVTIYLLGFAVGPLGLGPLSEMYGRYPVVILSTWFLCAWILGSALAPTIPGLIIMRLLAGIGGSAVMTIAPAVCADMFPVERRAFATAVITLAQCAGPARKSNTKVGWELLLTIQVGPLAGAFISEGLGWRWVGSEALPISHMDPIN
jgi:MFS family permease